MKKVLALREPAVILEGQQVPAGNRPPATEGTSMDRLLPRDGNGAVNWADLLESARNGSREALGALLEECRPYLLWLAQREVPDDLHSKAGASDMVQESFLEAQRDFAGFRGVSREELRGWLRQILAHNVANFSRHYQGTARRDVAREVPLEQAPPGRDAARQLAAADPSPSGAAIQDEETRRMAGAMRRLPEHYRQVLVWRHQDGLSHAEIGRRLGRSDEAVRKLWVRAVAALQQEMDHPTRP
jgi:RNA polymerase sigma-70 factor (ECF subfamily)